MHRYVSTARDRGNAVSIGIRDFAAAPINLVDTDIIVHTPTATALTGVSHTTAPSQGKEIDLQSVAATRIERTQNKQFDQCQTLNFAPMVLLNVCHLEHLGKAVISR